MEEQTENQKLSGMISRAYERDLSKPALKVFKELSRYSRKYGFPIVCTLDDCDESVQLHWAACLLVEVAGTWPTQDMPEKLMPEQGTALLRDAQQLCANGLSNKHHMRN